MRRLGALLLICLCLFSSAHAQEPSPGEALDAAFRRYSTLGGVVAVIQNGEVTFTHTFGVRKIGGDLVEEDTLFQVGSISKMIANIGLMQLLDEKGLTLETELGDVLGYPVRNPAYPQEPVTLRQLMTHTAGLRDSGDYQLAIAGHPVSLKKMFTTRGEYTFYSSIRPGSKREYSNLGGGLIGCLIEKLSGQTLDDYLQEHVFDPLGVNAAYQPSRFGEDAPFADMYHMPERYSAKVLSADKTRITQPDPDTHYFLTAGKLVISAPDLCKLLIALCDGGVYQNTRILSESAAQAISTPHNAIASVDCEAGHGLFMNMIQNDQVEGRTMYGHGGKANGMLCAAYFDPSDRTGVVMLTNGCQNESAHNGVGMLGRVIMRICYDQIIDPTHERKELFAVTD